MNNPSPLIPSGSLLEQRNKGRTKVKIAVFLVLAIHGIGLMALLMQGCKKEDANANANAGTSAVDTTTNTPAPTFVEPTNPPAPATNVAAIPTNVPVTPPPVETPSPVAPPAATQPSDYVIVKGDTFSTVAKKFHVTVKALEEANPSVEPTKLKIGQSIHVPAAVVMAATSGNSGIASPAAGDAASGGQTYSVKSGDSLSKIANEFGVSVKALRSANNLKTDKIVVGQKLKIPAKTSAPSTNASTAPSTSGGQ